MKVVSFSLEQGNKYFGRVDDGPKFLIGSRVSFQGNKGLMNIVGTPAQKYDRLAFQQANGFWADFIHPTAMAEGALYHTLNTYDRARFTFTFLQFAAHVPEGDFVVFLRALLTLPAASEYFPDLALNGQGRVCKVDGAHVTPIESDDSTDLLMDYFNPSSSEVEDTEVIQAARLVHWAQNDQAHRDLQVKVGIDHIKSKMKTYAGRYPMLHGAVPPICAVVMDIHHQGRAKIATVLLALQSANPLAALLEIGAEQYPERIATLTKEIKALTAAGVYGNLRYDATKNDFL
jgi:hypothetical protein